MFTIKGILAMAKSLKVFVLFALLALVSVAIAGATSDALLNKSFESGLTNWTMANKNGDKVVCQGDNNHLDRTGLCALLFKGNPGSNAVVKQNAPVSFLNDFNTELDSNFAQGLSYGAWRYSESSLTKLTIKLTVVRADGLRSVDKAVGLGITGLRADWEPVGDNFGIASTSTITKVTLKLIDKSNAGKQWIDDAYISISY
jgi:hypothetical protein